MSHRSAALVVVLAALLFTAAGAAVYVGVCDLRLTSAGDKQYIPAQELAPDAHGWFGIAACVRHDLAVVVMADGTAYKLGEPGIDIDEHDLIYTPLSAVADCADDRPPAHVYALVEDTDSEGTTLRRAAKERIAPPPVAAGVDGIIDIRAGDSRRASKAARKLAPELPEIVHVPLLKKGGRPGQRWVAWLTVASGLHGFLLLALGVVWIRRRARRLEALRSGELQGAEEEFFATETLE
jgi:hypothetical protein